MVVFNRREEPRETGRSYEQHHLTTLDTLREGREKARKGGDGVVEGKQLCWVRGVSCDELRGGRGCWEEGLNKIAHQPLTCKSPVVFVATNASMFETNRCNF